MEDRFNQRKAGYKKTVTVDDARRRREDEAVAIRKQQREEALAKRRNLAPEADSEASTLPAELVAQMPQALVGIRSEDPTAQLQGTQCVRRLLAASADQLQPIADVVAAGLVPRFMEFLNLPRPELQFEAAWILTNVASGASEHTAAVVAAGGIQVFVALLQTHNEAVKEQAVWALGNIAGESADFRDRVLQHGALESVLTVLRECEKPGVIRHATWTLSNLCRGSPPPPMEAARPALGAFANLLHSADASILSDSCWALASITAIGVDSIAMVIQAGVCRKLVELLAHPEVSVQIPALRTVGSIVGGDDSQTQVIIQCGVMTNLMRLLTHPTKSVKKEAIWTLSNIAAGTRDQIQEVINSGMLPAMLSVMVRADFDIQKECVWTLFNVACSGKPMQVEYLVYIGSIPPLCDLLSMHDTTTVSVALQAIGEILKIGRVKQVEAGLMDNPWCTLVEQAGGLAKIEALQEDSSEDIFRHAANILDQYFNIRMADSNEVPMTFAAQAPAQGFNFGA
mmetsp:Transcript_5325/g.13212  ORF Transcript_5325/g.13212 Transcript_5325/m.13212 type:complete len:513 (-) Transcript_5325:109-1647(-)